MGTVDKVMRHMNCSLKKKKLFIKKKKKIAVIGVIGDTKSGQ